MAAATDAARGAPMEEENPTLAIAEEDPPKKSEAYMDTTIEQTFVMPLEDRNPSLVVEEVPKIVEAAEKEAEAAKKGVVGAMEKEEEEVLERKDRGYGGLEAKNDEAEVGRGGDEHMNVEEAKKDGKVGILGVVEAMKNESSGEMTKDIEIVGSMVEPAPILVVEKKLETSELGDGIDCLASLDAVESEDKSDLLKEEQQEESGVTVETEVEGNAESIVTEEEKSESKGRKCEDVGFGGGDGVKSEEIGSGGRDGGKLDEEKEAKVSVATMFVETQAGAMVVNDRSIEDIDMACEDSVIVGSSEKKQNTEDQTNENEVKEEVCVVLEPKVTYTVPDAIEFDMAEDENAESEHEKSEEIESVGGNVGKLKEGKDIEVFAVSVEAIELEHKLGLLGEANEKFGYTKEGSDDIVDVNEGSADGVTTESAYSVLEDISKKEHNVDGQANTSGADEVGVVVKMYVADKVPTDAKSILGKDEKSKLEGVKDEEVGSGARDGGELDEEKEVEVSAACIVFVELEANEMVLNDRSIEDIDLACEDSVLMDSSEKKQNTEGQTTKNEVNEGVHVVLEPKVTYKVPDATESDMDLDEKAELEGDKSEAIDSIGGNGGELGEEKEFNIFPVTIEDIELEKKLDYLGETNEKFGYGKEVTEDVVDVNEGSVEEVIRSSTYSLLEGISKKHNVEGQATTSEGEEEVGVVVDMYVVDKVLDDVKSLLAKEEKPILEGMMGKEVGSRAWDGVELDEEKEVEVSIPSIVFVEPEACAMVVNNRSIKEVDLACDDSALVGSSEEKQNIEGQTTKNEIKEEVHVVVEPEVTYKVPKDTESHIADVEQAEPKGEKSDEIRSIGGHGGELDEGKDVDVFIVSVEAIELEDKLGTLAETNENLGYAKEGSDDIVDAKEGSVEKVTPASVFSVLEDIFEEYNVEGQATASDAKEEVCDIVEMYYAEKVSHDAKSLLANEEKPKLEGVKEVGYGGRDDGAKLDEGEAEVSIFSIAFIEPEASAMVVNDRSIEEVALANEDSVLMDCPIKKQSVEGHITEIEVKEEWHVVVEPKVIDKVPDDTESDMGDEEKPEPEGEKSDVIGSIGGNGGKLDKGKDIEVFAVSIETIELKDKLDPLAETNEKFGYAKEESGNRVDVKEGSVEEVTPSSVYNEIKGTSKKEHNAESQATTSEAEEEVGVVVDMCVPHKVPDDAKSLLAKEEKLELEGVKGEGKGSRVWGGVELDEEKCAKIYVASIAFVEQEACAMVVNDRSKEEVDLACEDIVLVGSPEKKQNTNSDMFEEEKAETEGVKDEEIGFVGGNGGELDEKKYNEVFTDSVEAIELEDKLAPLTGTNKEVGYVKERSDDIVVMDQGSVEGVIPKSPYGVLEDISKENSVEGQATASEAEDIGVVVEMYVADNVPDDTKYLLAKEEKPKLEDVKGDEVGYVDRDGGELDEKEGEVFVASIVFVELDDKMASFSKTNDELCFEKKESNGRVVARQEEALEESMDKDINVEDKDSKLKPSSEAGIMVDDGSMDEVAPASDYSILKNSPDKELNVEGQATTSEVTEEVCALMEAEVMNKVANDMEHVMAKEKKAILEGEKDREVGSLGGDGGELDEEKEVKIFNVIVNVVELEDKVANFPEPSGKLYYTKKGRGDEVVVRNEKAHKESTWNDTIFEGEVAKFEPESEASTVATYDGSVEEVEASAKSVLENSPWKEHDVEGQATTSETEEEVDVIVETEVLDDAKSVVAKEEELQLESEKGGKVGSGDGDGGVLYVGKELEVSVVSTAVVEPEDMVASFSKSNYELGFEKEVNNDIVVMGDEAPKESTKNDTYAEDDAAKLEQFSEMGIVGVNDGSIEEIAPASADSVLKYSSMKEQNTKGRVTSSEMEEEVGLVVQWKVMDKELNEMESVAIEEKVELAGDKSEEVGSIGGDGDESDMEKKAKAFVVSVEAIEFEHKCASIAETNFKLGYEKKARDDIVVVGDEEVPKESTKKNADIEKETSNREPSSEASTVVVNDGSLDELPPASADSVLESSPIKEVNFEVQAIASEGIKDVGVKKPSKVENIATAVQDLGVEKSVEVENIVGAVKGVDVKKLMKAENVTACNIDGTLSLELPPKPVKENNDAEETKGVTDVIHREEAFDDDSIIEVVPGYEDGYGNEGNEDELNVESNEATKQIMKEHVEGSSSGGASSSRDFTNSMDGKTMLDASKYDGDEKGVDSTTHAALLNSQNGASSDENDTISSQYGSKILTMDQSVGLGSLAPSGRPAPLNLLVSSELAVAVIADPTDEMTEEERKLHDKVELIRLKFLRLVYSLGATLNEVLVTQVLYRLGLAEGIMHGRQTKQASDLDNAWKKALTLEGEGKDDLNFSCNILVLGKIGVGKSATINSIFGEEKSKTDAFNSATTSVQGIVGDVNGVKIKIIDTPGLQPSVMDQGSNRKILAAVKKYTKKCPPDIVLYVDRLDSLSRDLNDLPLIKTITDVLGSSIWFNAIVALTHAASAPEELHGAHMTYEVLMAQTSHIIQESIRQATGDMNLMNPIAFVENHSSCQRNHEDQKVLPNGQRWRHHMLLLCYSSKILCEANSLLKLDDPNHGNLFGLGFHSLPLPFLMSSLLELRTHPKLSSKQDGNEGDSDTEFDGYSDLQQDDEEKEYDHLPAFKLLTKAQLAMLTTEQKNAYFDEYDYKVKLPLSFDCDSPIHRYRFLEPTSTVIARPILDTHGWDHDYGYDGVSVEGTLAILDMFPANVAVQVTKDKKEFGIHMDSSIAAKHGNDASSLARFDVQTIGHQLAYILRGETKIKNIKKNETTGGFLVTFLGDTMATGLKVEDQISLGKRLSLVASTGAIRAQGDTAYGAKFEARLKDKANPIGQSLSTLGLSLMKWHQDLALGANLQSQFSIGRGSKMALCLGLNNKLSGQIVVKTSTSEQVQMALLGLVPIAASIYRSFQSSDPSFA